MSIQTSVRFETVTEEEAGQRIDNYLLRVLPGVPRSRIYRAVRKGEVRVNKGRIKATYRVQASDIVRVPPLVMAEKAPPAKIRHQHKNLMQHVVFEDKKLLVIDKPSGMAVHGGSGIDYGLIDALREETDAPYLELVHRLDRDTSGCLMIAKRRSVLRACHELLRAGQMKKSYVALLQGHLPESCTINAPLRKFVRQSGERWVRVDEAEGKAAKTRFKVIQRFKDATLVDIDLLTGRTHQIRVHAAHMGHPVAGDPKYGDEEFNKHMQRYGLKRLFLHAQDLAWQLPDTPPGHAEAPLGASLQGVLKALPA